MTRQKLHNVVGALALALVDGLLKDVQREAPEPGPAAAAIALIGHAPGISIERLRRAMVMSHPGAVRLVDRLVEDGMVLRGPPAKDRRSVALRLTPRGEEASNAIFAARQRGLLSAMDVLSPSEEAEFARLAEKVLQGLIGKVDDAYRVCRLCDYRACEDCPVEAKLCTLDQVEP